jgi:hypothetical protein
MWVFIPSQNKWAWMDGSYTVDQRGSYSTYGNPGGRANAITWVDQFGYLWLFGGYGFDESAAGYLNDLWAYDGRNWAFKGGSENINLAGVYGTKGAPDWNNLPGGRDRAVSWVDSSGDFWLFGGHVGNPDGTFNDLWRFETYTSLH